MDGNWEARGFGPRFNFIWTNDVTSDAKLVALLAAAGLKSSSLTGRIQKAA